MTKEVSLANEDVEILPPGSAALSHGSTDNRPTVMLETGDEDNMSADSE
jgi:hypothetical protein